MSGSLSGNKCRVCLCLRIFTTVSFWCLEALAQIPTKYSSSKQLGILTQIPISPHHEISTRLAFLAALGTDCGSELRGSGNAVWGKLLHCLCQHFSLTQWIDINLSVSLPLGEKCTWIKILFRYCCLYWNIRYVTFQYGLDVWKNKYFV